MVWIVAVLPGRIIVLSIPRILPSHEQPRESRADHARKEVALPMVEHVEQGHFFTSVHYWTRGVLRATWAFQGLPAGTLDGMSDFLYSA